MEGTKLRGLVVGALNTRRGFKAGSTTWHRINLVRLMTAWLHAEHPGFTYTSTQLNKSTPCMMHVDKNNLGPSAFIALGDYEGGELWVDGMGAVDAKEKWRVFNSNEPHQTVPFTGGPRYSFVYFTESRYAKVPSTHVEELRQLGFHWPATNDLVKIKCSSSHTRIEKALGRYERWLTATGRSADLLDDGDTTNDTGARSRAPAEPDPEFELEPKPDSSLGHPPIGGVPRPHGRAPQGKRWDRVGGIWIDKQVLAEVNPEPDPDSEAFMVEVIWDHAGAGEGAEYLVKWAGYDSDEPGATSWEPASGVTHTEAFERYTRQESPNGSRGRRPKRSRARFRSASSGDDRKSSGQRNHNDSEWQPRGRRPKRSRARSRPASSGDDHDDSEWRP